MKEKRNQAQLRTVWRARVLITTRRVDGGTNGWQERPILKREKNTWLATKRANLRVTHPYPSQLPHDSPLIEIGGKAYNFETKIEMIHTILIGNQEGENCISGDDFLIRDRFWFVGRQSSNPSWSNGRASGVGRRRSSLKDNNFDD